jgi:hypothetical protein
LFAYDPDAQRGAIVFQEGDKFGRYNKEQISAAELERRYPGDVTSPYAWQKNQSEAIDAACVREVGSLANDARGSRFRNNARIWYRMRQVGGRRKKEICLQATRPIKQGEEIFVSYGPEYWSATKPSQTKRQRKRANPRLYAPDG